MNIQVIAFDLDGTVLADDKHLPEENRLALEAAAARGVLVVPATGRIVRAVPDCLRQLPFIRYYIVSNGATVYDAEEDRILYRGEIPAELSVRVCEYMDTLPVIYDCYQNDMGWMSRSHYERAAPYFVNEPHMMDLVTRLRVRVDDLKETLRQRGEPVQKLQMYFRPEDLPRRRGIMEELPRRFPGLVPTTSVSNNIEINSDRAGKGKALRALCAALGLDPAATLAFGDGSNDTELLRMAGCGVAMGNALEEVKAAADRVTVSNEACGVAREIRALLDL